MSAFDVNLVLSYRFATLDDDYLAEILPPFSPKRGARTPEKIAEQEEAHFDEWKAQADTNPHCIEVLDACLTAYFARKSHALPSRHAYRIKTTQDVAEVFAEIRGHVGLGTYRWFGNITPVVVKAWQFQLMSEGLFLSRRIDPSAFYSATHYDIGSLLKVGNPPIDTDILLERYLPAVAKEYYEANKPETKLESDAMLIELAFIAIGELPSDILDTAKPNKKATKRKTS